VVFKVKRFDVLYLHGWILWSAWSILGLMQLISIRYIKPYHLCMSSFKNCGLWLHVISGVLILIMTVTMCLLAFNFYSWHLRFNQSIHSAIGFIVLISSGLLTILGFLAWGNLAYAKGEHPSKFWIWSDKWFQATWLHKILAYVLLILSQIAIFLGVLKYNERTQDHRLGTANIVVFFSIWIALEINHQIKSRQKIELGGNLMRKNSSEKSVRSKVISL
jgi:hypothetical protein